MQHWLDYVTQSEVDITALTHWLDYVAEPEVDITALLYYCARPPFIFLRPVVFLLAASKPLLNIVNTTHFRRSLFTPYLNA